MQLPDEFVRAMREWWCTWCGWAAERRDLDRAGGFCPRCGSAELVEDERPDVETVTGSGAPGRLGSREALRTGLPGFPRGLRGRPGTTGKDGDVAVTVTGRGRGGEEAQG